MAEEKLYVINNVNGRFTINFMGAFPNNKFARKKGQKIYLTKEELEYVESNLSHLIGKSILLDGQEPEVDPEDTNKIDPVEFFELHHAKAKSQIKEMDSENVERLISYANDNELNNSVVKALVDRSNELGE